MLQLFFALLQLVFSLKSVLLKKSFRVNALWRGCAPRVAFSKKSSRASCGSPSCAAPRAGARSRFRFLNFGRASAPAPARLRAGFSSPSIFASRPPCSARPRAPPAPRPRSASLLRLGLWGPGLCPRGWGFAAWALRLAPAVLGFGVWRGCLRVLGFGFLGPARWGLGFGLLARPGLGLRLRGLSFPPCASCAGSGWGCCSPCLRSFRLRASANFLKISLFVELV